MSGNEIPESVRETYDRKYAGGDLTPPAYFPKQFRRILDLAVPEVARPGILDLGGGTGQYSLILQKLGYDVMLLDISAVAVNRARELGVRSAVCADFCENRTWNGKFDIILSKGFSLLNTVDLDKFEKTLLEMESLLTRDGAILFWSATDQSETWGSGRWFNFKKSTLRPYFDELYLIPALRYQLWMPRWMLAAASWCISLSPFPLPRPMTLIGVRHARPA